MDTFIEKRIKLIENVLNSGTISGKHYDSTIQPCFMRDENKTPFKINFEYTINLPEGLNQNISLMYKIIGDSEREVYMGNWTIMSLNKVKEIYKEYCSNDQKRIVDIAFTYMGLGHINVMSCDLETHNLFFHRAGGSNGWDRDSNYKETIKMDPGSVKQYYFMDWFQNLDKMFI